MGQKQCFLGKNSTITWYLLHLNLQICNYAQKRRICRENSKYALGYNFHGHFALAGRLPTSATLVPRKTTIRNPFIRSHKQKKYLILQLLIWVTLKYVVEHDCEHECYVTSDLWFLLPYMYGEGDVNIGLRTTVICDTILLTRDSYVTKTGAKEITLFKAFWWRI